MRHEQAVELTPHPVRQKVVLMGLARFSEKDLEQISLSSQDVDDYELLKEDYEWPKQWSARRRCTMMYTCNSEFQLVKYLEFINRGCVGELPPMDAPSNAVAGLVAEAETERYEY